MPSGKPRFPVPARAQTRKKGYLVKILAIGDITSPGGLAHLHNRLWEVRRQYGVDLCIANAENAAVITGIGAQDVKALFLAGVDVITGGNHTLRQRTAWQALDTCEHFLRPINFGTEVPGHGYTVFRADGYSVLVLNAMGNVHMEPVLDSPFSFIDRVLEREQGHYEIAVMDIHAEATGEKLAAAYAYDGRIQAIFGTHTHVPTADARILPGGTGYITDVGMCGESGGILGIDATEAVQRVRLHLPLRMKPASGECVANAVLFDVDVGARRAVHVERIDF